MKPSDVFHKSLITYNQVGGTEIISEDWPELIVRIPKDNVSDEGHFLMCLEWLVRQETRKRWQIFLERLEDRNVSRRKTRAMQDWEERREVIRGLEM